MPTQRALIQNERGGDLIIDSAFPVPKPGNDEVLIKVKAAGLNPGDAFLSKASAFVIPLKYPLVLGSDLAGEVVEVGEGVTNVEPGDRVITGGEFDGKYNGFQEYALADAYTLAKASWFHAPEAHIPESLSYDGAVTLPIALNTAYVGLYNEHPYGLALRSFLNPEGASAYSGQAIFISGGSGSAGTAAIQLAKLSGFSHIIATASLHNAEYLKSLGATHVIDRHTSPGSLAGELSKIDGLPAIEYAYDTYGRPDSSLPLAFAAVSPGGRVVTLNPIVKVEPTEGKTIAAFTAGKRDPSNRPHLIKFWSEATQLLADGKIKPANFEVLPGGLRGVEEGIKRLDEGKVSGVKLVVRPEETQ